MIHNGSALKLIPPIDPFYATKQRAHGVSYGLGEGGYDIRIAQTVLLHPLRRFRLVSSMETFTMPGHLLGVVHDKSTWARCGLSVFNTVLEPGWRGVLTLELVYFGWLPLRIPRGAGIAQVIFHEVYDASRRYDGKYQDQGPGPVAARFRD